jgi:hypothetical protein
MLTPAKKRTISRPAWLIGLAAAWLAVPAAMALPTMPTSTPSYEKFIGQINTFASWMYGILMALSVVFILYAAFLYLISQGSDERISTAKKVLIYAIVALVVAVLAGSVHLLVENFISGANCAVGRESCGTVCCRVDERCEDPDTGSCVEE